MQYVQIYTECWNILPQQRPEIKDVIERLKNVDLNWIMPVKGEETLSPDQRHYVIRDSSDLVSIPDETSTSYLTSKSSENFSSLAETIGSSANDKNSRSINNEDAINSEHKTSSTQKEVNVLSVNDRVSTRVSLDSTSNVNIMVSEPTTLVRSVEISSDDITVSSDPKNSEEPENTSAQSIKSTGSELNTPDPASDRNIIVPSPETSSMHPTIIVSSSETSSTHPTSSEIIYVPSPETSSTQSTSSGTIIVTSPEKSSTHPTSSGTVVVPLPETSPTHPTSSGTVVVPLPETSSTHPTSSGTVVVPLPETSSTHPTSSGTIVVSSTTHAISTSNMQFIEDLNNNFINKVIHGIHNIEICKDLKRMMKEKNEQIANVLIQLERNGERYFCLIGFLKAYGLKNKNSAYRWYEKASEKNDPLGYYFVGLCYEMGYGVTKDIIKSMEYYQRSADGGNAEAQFRIGTLMLRGKGGDKDEKKAV
ncbi:2698_t:CDS:1, partial [Acaulospora colombiana]